MQQREQDPRLRKDMWVTAFGENVSQAYLSLSTNTQVVDAAQLQWSGREEAIPQPEATSIFAR